MYVSEIARQLSDENPHVRSAALKVLNTWEGIELLPIAPDLRDLLSSETRDVRIAAVYLLKKVHPVNLRDHEEHFKKIALKRSNSAYVRNSAKNILHTMMTEPSLPLPRDGTGPRPLWKMASGGIRALGRLKATAAEAGARPEQTEPPPRLESGASIPGSRYNPWLERRKAMLGGYTSARAARKRALLKGSKSVTARSTLARQSSSTGSRV